MSVLTPEANRPPLTKLTEDEQMFRDAVRQFAEEAIAPRVAAMDASGPDRSGADPAALRARAHGHRGPRAVGRRRRFVLHGRVLVVEELSRVDPSVGVLVDVQNTLVNNCILRWGNDEQKAKYLPRLATEHRRRLRALRGRFRLGCLRARDARRARRATTGVLDGRKLWITNGGEAGLFIVFANVESGGGLQGHHGLHRRTRFRRASASARRKTSSASAPRRRRELILDDCIVPARERARRGRQGLQDRDRDAQRGPHRHRRADGRPRAGRARRTRSRYVKERKQFGKPIADFQGVQFQLAQMRDRARGRAAARLQRGAAQGRRPAVPRGGGDGQALRLPGRASASPRCASSSTAATASRRTTRSRSSTATRRSARSTRARQHAAPDDREVHAEVEGTGKGKGMGPLPEAEAKKGWGQRGWWGRGEWGVGRWGVRGDLGGGGRWGGTPMRRRRRLRLHRPGRMLCWSARPSWRHRTLPGSACRRCRTL